jgi:hypothetical protein
MPTWFPWIFIGGMIFAALSFVAAKYQGRQYGGKSVAQDFISGSVVITLLGVIAPDAFPEAPLPTEMPNVLETIGGAISGSSDLDLQIGPPPLARSH